jgi:hypothetical protein
LGRGGGAERDNPGVYRVSHSLAIYIIIFGFSSSSCFIEFLKNKNKRRKEKKKKKKKAGRRKKFLLFLQAQPRKPPQKKE